MKKLIAILVVAAGLLVAALPASADEDLTIHYPVPVANAMANYYVHGVGANPYGMPQGYANAPYGGYYYPAAPGYSYPYGAPPAHGYYPPAPGYGPAYQRPGPEFRHWTRERRDRRDDDQGWNR